MADSHDHSVTNAFQQLASGDKQAADLLWSRFFPRLRKIAENTLIGCQLSAVDPDDAAQSAFFCFWKNVDSGRFQRQLRRDDLWRLLAVITRRKALKQIERERAAKRGGGRVMAASSLSLDEDDGPALEHIAGQLPVHEFDLTCEESLSQLDEDVRVVVVLRLMGFTNREAAAMLECTESRVERKLELARAHLRSLLSP